MLKPATFIFLALYLPFLGAQDKFITIAPGAICQVWRIAKSYRPKPLVPPQQAVEGEFIDRGEEFGRRNLKSSERLASLVSENIFLVWSGYIRINKAGPHRFALDVQSRKDLPNILITINDQPVLEASSSGRFLSIAAALEPGMAKINISLVGTGPKGIGLLCKTSPEAEPVKITPAMFFHQTRAE